MDTGGYKVLIYHTHGSEAFADSRPGEVDDTVIGLGNRLAEILTDTYGIPVYHDTTAYDMMTGVLDRNASYDYSREGVSQILKDNPEIEVIIDLHRDGVPDDTHLVTDVDGKPTAQIMLLMVCAVTRMATMWTIGAMTTRSTTWHLHFRPIWRAGQITAT